MAEILKIQASEAPSSYSNHVLVEQTPADSFRATGACNQDGLLEYFTPPQAKDLATILKLATTWADGHGIHFVHVIMPIKH